MDSSQDWMPTPDNAHNFADLIVQAALENSGVSLDYSPASLGSVDEIIEGFRQEGETPDTINQTLFCFGCYVGEVFVKNVQAIWRNADETPMKDFAGLPLVIELPNGMFCNPVGKAFKRLQNGPEDSLVYFYHVFTARQD